MLSPGVILDNRYEILSPLAEGGMGAVYRARRTLLGDDVAIKVVRQDAPDLASRERFLRESRIAARLRHPSIVSILDFDMPESSDPYLVMELLSGPSLREEIALRGRLELADVQRVIPPICSALQLAHSQGVVHRDLKPANIVAHDYEPGQRVYKLVDFGVANLRQSSIETRLTGAYQFVGTVIYAAPEQINGAEVDARTDIYALGAVVFEMLTGHAPYAGDELMKIVGSKVSGEVPSVRASRPELPAWIDGVIGKALARDPEARWKSAAEFALALNPAADSPTGQMPIVAPASSLNTTYEVQDRIWTGRLGSDVYKGVHRALGHPVAIRILREGSHPNWSAARERFLREAKSLQVAHESILNVRDFGEEPGLVYIITDYIEGPTVRQVLTDEGRIPWPRLRPLLDQLLDAVQALHRRNAVICGLRPEIMRIRQPVADDDQPQLLISTAGIWNAHDLLATLHEQTLRGMAIQDVELRYVAPELLTGGAVDVRSDVFTIGVLAYEMATGAVPFDGRTMHELLGKMLAGAPEDPRTLAPELPDAVAVALLRALRPPPSERFQRVREFTEALP
ncbi:MAG TPA: serine/threonine-protein kinase [Vicinamibacterales bacterium]